MQIQNDDWHESTEDDSDSDRIKTVSNPPFCSILCRLSAERKQTPQIVEKQRNRIGLKEALETVHAPPEQKVRGSNPLGHTTFQLLSNFQRPEARP